MADFTAKDVQRLRQATGAGMLDAKKRARGERRRHGRGGAVAARARAWPAPPSAPTARPPRARSPPCATATSPRSSSCAARPTSWPSPTSSSRWSTSSPRAVAAEGEDAVGDVRPTRSTRLRTTLKENISVGAGRAGSRPSAGQVVDTYLHQQAGRGVNAVAVVIEGGTEELAHDIAVHIAFAKPPYLTPRRGARGRRRRRARDGRGDLAQRGQARGRARRRSSRDG